MNDINDSTLNTMESLEIAMEFAIRDGKSIGLYIEMPGFEYPELIINPWENLPKKLEYYKATYDDNLEHKYSKGIKIIEYTIIERV